MSQAVPTKSRKPLRNFALHLHPVNISKEAIRFNRTFGLGGMAALLFIIQAFTGILLRFLYEPVPEKAYDSILFIQNEVLFGQFVRNIHHWSGIFFVLVTFLHLLRTFYAQSYYSPRRINWVIGVVLLFIVILSNFTGYLLPWDQLAFWAITVSTNMLEYFPLVGGWLQTAIRGGAEVGPATLLNFYNFHTGILPLSLIALMGYHFWRVRKAKGVALPESQAGAPKINTWPDLVLKEVSVALVLIAIILLISVFGDAPLLDRANPAYSPNPAKAPWYFMGVQELLLHFHPFFAVVVIPVLFFVAMFCLPYYKIKDINPGTWFHSEKGKKLTVYCAILALVVTPLTILLDEYVLDFEKWLDGLPLWLSTGLVPFVLLVVGCWLLVLILRKRFKADKVEVIISMFTMMVVSYAVLTIVGIAFRGPGMVLFSG
ncbi:MAG: cytochrome b N-terminal domain-containing protein [Bacteroidota bacterium]|nr:cytochrome b N-terminal domain-containing protein [Bacteroidota bacterium]